MNPWVGGLLYLQHLGSNEISYCFLTSLEAPLWSLIPQFPFFSPFCVPSVITYTNDLLSWCWAMVLSLFNCPSKESLPWVELAASCGIIRTIPLVDTFSNKDWARQRTWAGSLCSMWDYSCPYFPWASCWAGWSFLRALLKFLTCGTPTFFPAPSPFTSNWSTSGSECILCFLVSHHSIFLKYLLH